MRGNRMAQVMHVRIAIHPRFGRRTTHRLYGGRRRAEHAFIGADPGHERSPASALLMLGADKRHGCGKGLDDFGQVSSHAGGLTFSGTAAKHQHRRSGPNAAMSVNGQGRHAPPAARLCPRRWPHLRLWQPIRLSKGRGAILLASSDRAHRHPQTETRSHRPVLRARRGCGSRHLRTSVPLT